MYWRSQNVRADVVEFTLAHHKPINTGIVDARYTQQLFDAARGPYVAFGIVGIPRALVFRVIRTGQSTLLSLIPRMSQLPSDELAAITDFFKFVFDTASELHVGPKRDIRLRFSQEPFIQNALAALILNVGVEFGFLEIKLDGRRTTHSGATLVSRLMQNTIEIKDNFVMAPFGRAPREHTPAVDFFVAKRKLENFMLENDIQENPQQDGFPQTFHDELLELYSQWFHAFSTLEDDEMPVSLRRALGPETTIEECRIELTTKRKFWATYFMQQETKYPMLVASAYLWRIGHWLALREH